MTRVLHNSSTTASWPLTKNSMSRLNCLSFVCPAKAFGCLLLGCDMRENIGSVFCFDHESSPIGPMQRSLDIIINYFSRSFSII